MFKHQLTRKQLKYFSKMAAEAYVNDPVHSYVTKNKALRKKFVYHFMIERLATSSREDIIYIDEENRGICVWRKAHNEYDVIDFLMYLIGYFCCYTCPRQLKHFWSTVTLMLRSFPKTL